MVLKSEAASIERLLSGGDESGGGASEDSGSLPCLVGDRDFFVDFD